MAPADLAGLQAVLNQRAGLRFAILEAAPEVGGSWPRYYDNLRLFSPISRSSLPGLAFPGSPDHYPARDEVVAYLQQYAANFQLPIITDAPVVRVDQNVVQELLPCVAAMVNELPDTYREALRLTEYEGLSQKELGERQGISFSGAKSRVQRARAKIKEQLLACCHFQFDHAGRIIDYQPRCACCASSDCDTTCSK